MPSQRSFTTARSAALATVSALAVMVAAAGPAAATLYTVDVYEASGAGAFDATLGSVNLLKAQSDVSHAQFTYNGDLNFANRMPQNNTPSGDNTTVFFGSGAQNISNYQFISGPSAPVYGSLSSLGNYLNSSGSIAGYGYGSLYVFTYTGSTTGTNLTITHDDGVGVYSAGALLPGTTTGPTGEITETIQLPAGSGYQIVFGRENGSPSILNVAVPEPASMAVLGAGLFGFGLLRRKRA